MLGESCEFLQFNQDVGTPSDVKMCEGGSIANELFISKGFPFCQP